MHGGVCVTFSDEHFSVSSVNREEVIHASDKEAACIFKVHFIVCMLLNYYAILHSVVQRITLIALCAGDHVTAGATCEHQAPGVRVGI